jgi:hypothetical protein
MRKLFGLSALVTLAFLSSACQFSIERKSTVTYSTTYQETLAPCQEFQQFVTRLTMMKSVFDAASRGENARAIDLGFACGEPPLSGHRELFEGAGHKIDMLKVTAPWGDKVLLTGARFKVEALGSAAGFACDNLAPGSSRLQAARDFKRLAEDLLGNEYVAVTTAACSPQPTQELEGRNHATPQSADRRTAEKSAPASPAKGESRPGVVPSVGQAG